MEKIIKCILPNMNLKFTTKLFMIHTLILVCMFALISIIISVSLSRTTTRQAIDFNMQVLISVDTYFNNKCKSLKSAMQTLYTNPESQITKDIMTFLRKQDKLDNWELNILRTSFNKFLNYNGFALDNDLLYMSINNDYDNIYLAKYISSSDIVITNKVVDAIKSNRDNISGRVNIITVGNLPDKMIIIFDRLKADSKKSETAGYIAYGYNYDFLKNSYHDYNTFLKGYILVFDRTGHILYDSSGKFGENSNYFDALSGRTRGTVYSGEDIINVYTNFEYGFITVGVLPKNEIQRYDMHLNITIITVASISLVIILLFMYLGNKLISRRVSEIIKAIARIRKGDLSVRIKESGRDELHEIASNLNIMCAKLKEHIDKEYIFNLKQKEAELYALQSQINPHFLYNTLESIRMKALQMGNSDVSKMITILSELFRRNKKGNAIIGIREEIEYVKAFIDLYRIRYNGRLEAEYFVDPKTLNYCMVKHLIQPVVENSLTHGLIFSSGNRYLNIKVKLIDNDIYFTVYDNGQCISSQKLELLRRELENLENPKNPINYSRESIGLANVAYRIRLIYGRGYGLSVNSSENNWTEVILKIKAKTREELLSDVQCITGG